METLAINCFLAPTQPRRRTRKPITEIIMIWIKGTFWTNFADIHVRQEAIQTCFGDSILLLAMRLLEPVPHGGITISKLLHIDAFPKTNGFRIGNPLDDGLKPEARAWCQHALASRSQLGIDS